MALSISSSIQVNLDPTIEVGWELFFLATADHEDPADSVAIMTLRMNSSSRTMRDMFSMTPADLRQAVKTS